MSKSFGVATFFVGLCLATLYWGTGNAVAQKDFQCGAGGIACPGCQDGKSSDGTQLGCWVWGGPVQCTCIAGGTGCDNNAVQIRCSGAFFQLGSCSGVMCSPNQCCSQSGIFTGDTKTIVKGSCICP